jgi:hypothetical protein
VQPVLLSVGCKKKDTKGKTVITIKPPQPIDYGDPLIKVEPRADKWETEHYVGRVMISTTHDDHYYTNVNTTKSNGLAQTQDGKITATVHLPVDWNGKTVYFRVIDPDDQSPYEPDIMGDDNFGGSGALSSTQDVAVPASINGQEVAAAEAVLSITTQHSGDNYQVQASLDPLFGEESNIGGSEIFLAWKRIYLERDVMYKYGATLLADFIPDGDANDDVLTADNTADFEVGDAVTIFGNSGNSELTSVRSKTATTLTVGDLSSGFSEYAGVKRTDNNEVLDIVPIDLLPQAYGDLTDGRDGGCFVEFVPLQQGSGPIPKYKELPDNPFDFMDYWFEGKGDANNLFQHVTAYWFRNYGLGGLGFSATHSAVTARMRYINAVQAEENFVHELTHCFLETWEAGTYIDDWSDTKDWSGTQYCVMNYNADDGDGLVEFSKALLYVLRRSADPQWR